MGGVSSYRKEVFERLGFSEYFEGYGLYEDTDFSLRLSKIGDLYVNTAAQLEHHHEASGRPNKFKYGKMVIRNGWYVWRVKYNRPSLGSRIKWNLTGFVLTVLTLLRVFTKPNKMQSFSEGIGRITGWFSLIINKPRMNV